MKSIYDKSVTDDLIQRVGRLTPESTPVWGTMTVDQMLAHCSVPYEMAFAPDADQRFKKATGLKKWFLTKFLKPVVVGEKPYRKGLPTAPEFKMVDQRDFDVERDKLLGFVRQSHEQGRQLSFHMDQLAANETRTLQARVRAVKAGKMTSQASLSSDSLPLEETVLVQNVVPKPVTPKQPDTKATKPATPAPTVPPNPPVAPGQQCPCQLPVIEYYTVPYLLP